MIDPISVQHHTVFLHSDAGGLQGFMWGIFDFVLICACFAIVWAVLQWIEGKNLIPAPFNKVFIVFEILLVIIGAIFCINFLLDLGGHGFIAW